MPIEQVQEIIARAITEEDYRTLLFENPDEALQGYELTQEESSALKSMDSDQFNQVVSEVEERLSRAGLMPSFASVATAGKGSQGSRILQDSIGSFFDISKG